MKNKFYILMMFVALGVFIIPKQILLAQTHNMECCDKTETSAKCHSDKDNDNEPEDCSNNQNPCSGKCCVNCTTCSIFSVLIVKPDNESSFLTYGTAEEKVLFNYSTPHISYGLRDIWQPPKIS